MRLTLSQNCKRSIRDIGFRKPRKVVVVKLVSFKDIQAAGVSPKDCLDWVAESIANKQKAVLPPKISLHPPIEGSFCNFMPSIVSDSDGKLWGGVKLVTRYPEREPALDSKLLLFDAQTGEMLALMDADWITAMRTGAVAAHSINLLARSGFDQISVMGLGNTGRACMLMLAESIEGRELNVRLRRYKGQEDLFVERFKEYENLSFDFVDGYDELVRGSQVVVSAVTYLADDVCGDDCFDEGVLVVPVHTRGFSNCDLFFDKVFADDTGHVKHFKNFAQFKRFAEVSDVVNGRVAGRENDKERILAYNIGVSMHDITFAAKIFQELDKDSLQDLDLSQPAEKFWV